jgi:hypothetical protein
LQTQLLEMSLLAGAVLNLLQREPFIFSFNSRPELSSNAIIFYYRNELPRKKKTKRVVNVRRTPKK